MKLILAILVTLVRTLKRNYFYDMKKTFNDVQINWYHHTRFIYLHFFTDSASSSNWETVNEISTKSLRGNSITTEKDQLNETDLTVVDNNSQNKATVAETTTVIENFTAIPEEKYQLLVDLILENKTMIQIVLNKVNTLNISNGMGNQSESSKENILRDDLIRELPLSTIENLLIFEEKLKSEKDASIQLVIFLLFAIYYC